MDGATLTQLVFGLAGGLALFIYGMQMMSQGLADAVGNSMQTLLAKATRNRVAGLGLGTAIGTLIQSSATVVLFIGFINAGLMTLPQAVAPVMGANIGTTLSMQLVSFRLTDYCLPAIFLGLVLHMVAKNPRLKHGGFALMGFGLLFLGMGLMGDSIRPHRELFEPWLAQINGATLRGLLTGTLISMLVTGVVQSSGAVIGMGYAMVSAGAITGLEGIFPIIIGANIGTCVTGLIGSIGTTVEARRTAMMHLLFNLTGTALAIPAAPLFYKLIPYTSADVVRQAANADTLKMVAVSLILLPFTPLLARAVRKVVPDGEPEAEPSHLDEALLNRPEQAIFQSLRELQRTAGICAQSLQLAAREFVRHEARTARRIRINEQSINAIKLAMRDYLSNLTHHYLSRRQAILIEHIDRCMSDLERVGDHVANLATIAGRQRRHAASRFIPEAIEDWLAVHHAVAELLENVIDSLDPESADFQTSAKAVLEAAEHYKAVSLEADGHHFQRLEEKTVTPMAGLLFYDYLSNFSRMAKHIKSIAHAEQQPRFWLKREKLDQVMSGEAPGYTIAGELDANDYLERLQRKQTD